MYKPTPDEVPATTPVEDPSSDAIAPTSNQLVFDIQAQQQMYWAWAAVSASVANYYNRAATTSQCQLANWAFGETNCCIEASSSRCNQPYKVKDTLQHLGHLRQQRSGAAILAEVIAEIDAGHPIVVTLQWAGGGMNHPVVITGYDNTSGPPPTLTIKDPGTGAGTSVVPFTSFPANYQGGATWAYTDFTQP